MAGTGESSKVLQSVSTVYIIITFISYIFSRLQLILLIFNRLILVLFKFSLAAVEQEFAEAGLFGGGDFQLWEENSEILKSNMW